MYPLLLGYGYPALFIVRLALGLILIVHGWPKISDVKKTGAAFDGMGFKPGIFWGLVAGVVEFFGGIAIVFGIFTGLVAFVVAVQFGVIIIWKLAKGMPFVGGWEFDLLIFAVAVMLMAYGAGHLALGGMMGGGNMAPMIRY